MTVDAKKMLDQFLNSGMATGLVAGLVGGALARGTGLGGIAKIGGVALVGTLAYQAWQKYQQQQAGLAPEQRAGGSVRDTVGGVLSNLPGIGDLMKAAEGQQTAAAAAGFGSGAMTPAQQNHLGTGVLVAMIAAAKADGEVDQTESQKIFGQMEQAGLTSEEKAFLLGELSKPVSVEDVAKYATSPEIAAQLYTASAIIVDNVNEKERAYLAALAKRLDVPSGFVDQLNQQIGR